MASHTGHSSPAGIPDRSKRILATLVQQYIEQGEPVSSLWLAQHGGFGLSSATVRSILTSLEDLGYLHHPHPSSGLTKGVGGGDTRGPQDWSRCFARSRTITRSRRAVRAIATRPAHLVRYIAVQGLLGFAWSDPECRQVMNDQCETPSPGIIAVGPGDSGFRG